MALRFDIGELGKAEKTPQGGMRVAAHLTRTGVFKYDDGKGGTISEYRPPEEVFHADSLATLADAPLTVGHPGLVTPDNHQQNAIGHVRDIKQDGERVAGVAVIQGRKAIKAIEKGVRQVSCGYTCRVDEEPGTAPDGTRYDRVQRGIRYNHVALVDKGRAGDEVRLRLDSAGNQTSKEVEMEFERIDGIKYEVDSDAHKAAVQRRDEADKKRKAEADALQARADAAEAKVTELKKELSDAPAKIAAAVATRAALETGARKILGAEVKFDGISDAELRKAVAAKANPTLKLDGKSDAYVEALYDTAIANVESGEQKRADEQRATGQMRVALVDASRQDAAPDADKSRDEMIKRNRNAWKTDAAASAGK